ncbi:MAG: hypothetical protein LAT84_02375 [Balneolia bacterium]|nr:hypothetical protein [Balneolia bacterium]
MLLPIRIIPFAVGALLLFSCGSGSDDQTDSSAQSGDEIPDGPEITYQHVLNITGGDNVTFNRISDLWVTSEGDILIFDAGASKAHLFDADGNYLSSGIGEGQLPGEVRDPVNFLGMNDNNEFVIYSHGLMRYSVYSIENRKIIPVTDFHTMQPPLTHLPYTVLADGPIMFFDFGLDNKTGELNEFASLMDREGEIVREGYISFPATEISMVSSTPTPFVLTSPHGRMNKVALHGNTMVRNNQKDLGFQRYSLETGELLNEVSINTPDLPVSREENRDLLDLFKGDREIESSLMEDLLDQMPEVRGNVSHIRYDPAGYVWLLLLPHDEEDPKLEWLVFTEEGDFAGRMTQFERANILRVHNGNLYQLTHDENELPMVRVLRTDLL